MSWSVHIKGALGGFNMDLQFETSATPLMVIGPNGSGKSTLLKAVAGADLALQGSIKLMGEELWNLPAHERKLGYVPQGFALFEHMDVKQNVAFGAAKAEDAQQALQDFDATELSHRFPAALSGGEKQKVALARAWASHPRALLLDEPLSALDASNRRQLRSFLAHKIQEHKRPAIVVTHDPRTLRAFQGQILVMDEGKAVALASLSELRKNPPNDFVVELLDVNIPTSSAQDTAQGSPT